ncbi:RNA pseudouridine synthase [Acetobacter pasteurianus]|nr:RNA pseudouridine synthase [Acetobacter pasteurianus]
MVIALRKQPLLALQHAFATKTAQKTYWAIVQTGPQANAGRIDLPLEKQSSKTGWRMVTSPSGAPAATRWKVLGRSKDLCWLELTLETGRTHQARVHCAAMNWPIVGDPLYGTPHPQGLHLLARSLTLPFALPITAIAPPRPGMTPALQACGWIPNEDTKL